MVAPGLLAVSTPVVFAVILPATGLVTEGDGMQMLKDARRRYCLWCFNGYFHVKRRWGLGQRKEAY